MLCYVAALVQQGTTHLLHMGTMQLASLLMIAAFTSTFKGKIRERRHCSKTNKVRRSEWFLSIPFQRQNLQEIRTPLQPTQFNNEGSFLLLFQRDVSTLMNSKMLRFAFQFGNLPLKGDKAPLPAQTPALNHIKHTAIFCKALQQCHCGSPSPSLCLLLFVGLFTS